MFSFSLTDIYHLPTINHMASIHLSDDSASRLYSRLYSGYVNNRNKEMDRVDTSTGWSFGILILSLSLMINAQIPYYYIPFAAMFLIPFLFKETRRYIYYMFWSLKESEMETEMLRVMKERNIDTQKLSEIISIRCPTTILSLGKSMNVRFYRSYIWMFFIIFLTTFFVSLQQLGTLPAAHMVIFSAMFLVFVVVIYHGRDELIMPRKTIMRMGISRHHK